MDQIIARWAMATAFAAANSFIINATNADTFRARAVGNGLGGVYYDTTTGSNTGFVFGPFLGSGSLSNGTFTDAESAVSGSLSSGHVLGLIAESHSFGNANAVATAFGAYRDIITITGVTPPASVRLTFSAHCSLLVEDINGFLGGGNAGMSVSFLPYEEQGGFSGIGAGVSFSRNPDPAFLAQGFETSEGNQSGFTGTVSVVVPFDAVRGGYAFQLSSAVSSSTVTAHATTDATSGISLDSITNPDHSPITGATFTFASGMQMGSGACPADFDGDGTADFFDYDAFVVCFEGGSCPPGQTADFDGDGSVDFFDYDAFVVAFEAGC